MRRFRTIVFACSLAAALSLGAAAASAQTTPAPSQAPTTAQVQAQQKAANAPIPIHTEIVIPTSPVEQGVSHYANGVVRDVADYIQVVYNFMISIVGLVAAVMMIIGGFQYLTSAGDAGKIGAAKKRIGDALIGLVLALSSYALLNTINPALLSFKPLSEGVTGVSTHLSFLAWCEDVAAQGTTVLQVNGKECGNVGKYLIGNDLNYCAYRGSCSIKAYNFGWDNLHTGVATCLQQAGLTTTDVDKALKQNPIPPFALCLPCANLSPSVAASLHMGIDAACSAWQDAVTAIRTQTPNQNLWSSCQAASGYPGCVQADIDCREANDNADKHNSECDGGGRDSGHHSCGCEGYDDEPATVVMDHDMSLEEEQGIEGKAGAVWTHQDTLDLLPSRLADVCAWNPCQNYKDDGVNPADEGKHYDCSSGGAGAVINDATLGLAGAVAGVGEGNCVIHAQAYKNGCHGIGISRFVPGVRMFTSDCRNN